MGVFHVCTMKSWAQATHYFLASSSIQTRQSHWPRLHHRHQHQHHHHRHYRFTHQLQLLVLNYSLAKFQSIWMKPIFCQCFNALVISMNLQYFRMKTPERIEVSELTWRVYILYYDILFIPSLVAKHTLTHSNSNRILFRSTHIFTIMKGFNLHNMAKTLWWHLPIDGYLWCRWWVGICNSLRPEALR